MIAASQTVHDRLLGIHTAARTVTRMRLLPQAAGMERRKCGRQRNRSECSDKRQHQQESGSPALHAFVNQNPKR